MNLRSFKATKSQCVVHVHLLKLKNFSLCQFCSKFNRLVLIPTAISGCLNTVGVNFTPVSPVWGNCSL